MMKQPAENTNATAEEIRTTQERSRPLERNGLEDRERSDELAHHLAPDREPDEAARARAGELLRNRKNAEAKP
jgi:hypothetical protein